MTINRCMALLVDELLAADVPDPLRREFTLAAVWDDLARLGGETVPDEVRIALGEPIANIRPLRDAPSGLGAKGEERTVNGVLIEHLTKLEWWGIPAALTQPLMLGPLWAELSRIAGEEVAPAVRELLDWRVYRTLISEPTGPLGQPSAGGERQ